MPDVHTSDKAVVERWRWALYDFDRPHVLDVAGDVFDTDAVVHLTHPFETLGGATALVSEVLGPLAEAWPDLERRDTIVMAGPTPDGDRWVGTCGYYTGTFVRPWLGIPPTGRQVAMRFHEFFRVLDGRVVEMQGLWDLPEVMMQAGAWPLSRSLGREWQVPAPATACGVMPGPHDADWSARSVAIVEGMLTDMGRHPAEPPEVMRLEHWWHPKMSWYGPAGIGTARGIDGFRRHHQIPFLAAMPDRRSHGVARHLFGDGDYVGFTAWPGMAMTLTGDGWLGIAPGGQELTMRSLDFWRCEGGRIRENWVLVDLLHVYDQLGVDVLARMRELVGSLGSVPPHGG